MKLLLILSVLSFSLQLWAKRPKWINEPMSGCNEMTEICAVGEGSGHMIAESNARNELAKIFETQVKSKSTFSKEMTQLSDADGIIGGEVSEDVQTSIQEITDQVLQGVEIKQKYEDSESVFALAALDKRRARKRLQTEMEQLDEKISAAYEDGRRSQLNKAYRLMSVRERLDIRHEFISGKRFPGKVSLRDILRAKAAKRKLGTVVLVKFEEISNSGEMKHFVIQQLLESDYKVVDSQKKGHQYRVLGRLVSEKRYLNVEGFEKYNFLIKIKSLNGKGEKIGSMEFTTEQTGRDFKQAYAEAIPVIKKYLYENLGELNID